MNRNRRSIWCGRRWICLTAAVTGIALLLVFGPAVTALAGPAQEKGQEEPEEKEEPKKFTNKDLKKPAPSPGGGSTGSSGEEGVTPETGEGTEAEDPNAEPKDPWADVGVATDDQGRGETYWRQAMTEARAAVTSAKEHQATLQSEMNRRRADFTAIDDPAARDQVNERIEELYDLLANADKAIKDAEQALSDLQEEARRSGALPGWLR